MRMDGIPTTRDEQLEAVLERLPDLEKEYEDACKNYATAESDYRIEFSRAFLKAEGTEKARNADALIAVEKYLRERDRCEAVRDFTKEKIKDCQLVISARQSLLRVDVNTSSAFGR